METERAQQVLDFWFNAETGGPARWFRRDPQFDETLRTRFGADVDAALAGRLDAWAATAEGALALVVLLDQLTRNLFRGDGRAFDGDERARRIADDAIARRFDAALPVERRRFLYMPFVHSEQIADQHLAVTLFEGCADDDAGRTAADFARRHCVIVERFGRFPHRNAALGRTSTAEELEFLQQPGSSF
jgi:uncharacterized protein (DUF924 family)